MCIILQGINKDVVINYTLDNYITVFYNNGSSTYETYSGFLIDTSKTNAAGTTYDGINIDNEALSEVNRTSFEANQTNPQKINYKYFTNNNGRRKKNSVMDKKNRVSGHI